MSLGHLKDRRMMAVYITMVFSLIIIGLQGSDTTVVSTPKITDEGKERIYGASGATHTSTQQLILVTGVYIHLITIV